MERKKLCLTKNLVDKRQTAKVFYLKVRGVGCESFDY